MQARPSRHAGKLFVQEPSSPAFSYVNDPHPNEAKDDVLVALEEKLGREEAHELHELFKLVDKDNGGSISQDEFMELLHTMSVRPAPHEMDLMYDELDADGDGVIEYTEFLKFMCSPGVQSANGATLLQAFQYLESYAYDCGKQHPPSSGKTGRGGVISTQDLSSALRTYLPDKVKTEKDAQDILKSIRDVRGLFDYRSFIIANVNPATLPQTDENGKFIFEYPKKSQRLGGISATEALQRATDAAAATPTTSEQFPSLPHQTTPRGTPGTARAATAEEQVDSPAVPAGMDPASVETNADASALAAALAAANLTSSGGDGEVSSAGNRSGRSPESLEAADATTGESAPESVKPPPTASRIASAAKAPKSKTNSKAGSRTTTPATANRPTTSAKTKA